MTVNVTQLIEEVLYTEKYVNVTQIIEEVLYTEKVVNITQIIEEVLYVDLAASNIDRTGKGKGQDKAASDTLVTPTFTISVGASLVLLLVHDPTTVNSVTWNSIGLTKDIEVTQGSSVQVSIWSLRNNSQTATSTLTVTFSSAIVSKSFTIIEAKHLLNIPLEKDVVATGSGASGDPSTSGATPNKAEAVAIGVVGLEGPVEDTAGTWSNSYENGEEDGTTGGVVDSNVKLSHGFKQLTAISSQTAAKTGNTSRPWAAALAIYVASAPVVSSFSPSANTTGGQVVITGEGFGAVSSVKFNGISATYTVDSPTQIRALVPVGNASGFLTVVTAYGQDDSSSEFGVIPSLSKIFTHSCSIQTGGMQVTGY